MAPALAEMSAPLQLRRLAVLLAGYAYRYGSETQLHEGIASVLTAEGIPFEHEVAVDARNRMDFLVNGVLAIEIKVDGSFAHAIAQVSRYSALDTVHGVLLAATPQWARQTIVRAPGAFHGKPIAMAWLRRKAL